VIYSVFLQHIPPRWNMSFQLHNGKQTQFGSWKFSYLKYLSISPIQSIRVSALNYHYSMKLQPSCYLYYSRRISNTLLGLLPQHFFQLQSLLQIYNLTQLFHFFYCSTLLFFFLILRVPYFLHLLMLLLLFMVASLRFVLHPSLRPSFTGLTSRHCTLTNQEPEPTLITLDAAHKPAEILTPIGLCYVPIMHNGIHIWTHNK